MFSSREVPSSAGDALKMEHLFLSYSYQHHRMSTSQCENTSALDRQALHRGDMGRPWVANRIVKSWSSRLIDFLGLHFTSLHSISSKLLSIRTYSSSLSHSVCGLVDERQEILQAYLRRLTQSPIHSSDHIHNTHHPHRPILCFLPNLSPFTSLGIIFFTESSLNVLGMLNSFIHGVLDGLHQPADPSLRGVVYHLE